MNAQTKIQTPSTDIAIVVEQTPVIVLTDHDQRESFYAHIQREVDAFEAGTSTKKGRDAIKAFAYKITRTKTAIDDAGKKLNEEARARINAVDAERRTVKERLTELAAAVRLPLTEWEEFEAERVEKCRAIIAGFKAASVVTMEDTTATIRARGAEVWNTAIDADVFADMADEANAAKDLAVSTLKAAMARLVKEEADKAELEKLRAEAAEREERERAEREAREAEERRAAEAKAAEERRIAAEKAEADRIEQAKQEAAADAERAAQAEQAKRDREHAEALAAERQRAEAAERAAQAERDRIAAEEAAKQAEAKRLADEHAAREADQAHRGAVMKAAKEAIMTCGVDEDTAKKIVLLIRSGEVPNVSLRF